MKQQTSYVFLLAIATSSLLFVACGDDDASTPNDNGGAAGEAGTKAGGSSAGGSSNKAGNNSGGKAGSGTAGAGGEAEAGAAGAGEAGGSSAGAGGSSAGAGGSSAGAGGSNAGAGGGDDMGGAAGTGGAGEPALDYACGSANLFQKTCSAWVAAECPDATACSDCVTSKTEERAAINSDNCDACSAKYDAYLQCQIDAFESRNLSEGVICFDGAADASDSCYELFFEASDCQGYVGSDQDPQPCPASWPPPTP